MRCSACQHQSPSNAKFCTQCGAALKPGCSNCGVELAPQAKFCHECGTPTAESGRPSEAASARKIVSILFADLVGSTGLQERLDPESTRRFMESYYDVARQAVTLHGGKVTQFLGDGVKAVFGVPRVAEDDAIRAVRAAAAMQQGFRKLAEQQAEAVGSTGLRVAVNTGEVIAEGETEIIGDPVNVAARLQEHGKDGDVVIGESTEHLVANQFTLELLGAFGLKGRSGNVKAYKLLSLEPPQRKVSAFVGREKELARLSVVYDQALAGPSTKMAVLLGSAGLGKSRLIGEFARRSATVFSSNASVIQAHCDAAKGATFSPLADAFRKHLGLAADASTEIIQESVDKVLAADEHQKRIASGIVGLLIGQAASPEETFFVVRRFLTAMSREQPVVLIIDDLHWAEPLLFDLLEHLVQWGQELPLFLLIGARPELREARSSFTSTGGFVGDLITLEGLDANASMQLAAGVIGAGDLPAAVAAKVLATTEGNPLFISELIRMLVVEGALIHEDGEWRSGESLATVQMPPTIHALLASRIERLKPLDCAILERAAVVGRQFSRNAVTALLPNDPDEIDARLEALQGFELIERGTGWYIGDPVLRFHHVLIRDAAYRRLLKGSRAELHANLANWIEQRVGESHEHDELIGRHLEDAHRLLGELGPLDVAAEELGERAAARLSAAGRRALEADDVPLAATILGRALQRMRPDHPERADLCIDWSEALLAEGEVSTAEQGIEELGRLMQDSPRLIAWQHCLKGHHTVLTAPRELSATVASVAKAAETLAGLEDSAGEAKAHFVHAIALSRQGQIGACEAALDQALAAARKAQDRRQANTVLAIAPVAALWGPSPVTRASGRCLDVVRVLRITQGAPAVEAVALMCQGVLEALRGRSDAAHRMIESGREMVEELGIAPQLRNADAFAGYVHLLEGELSEAEEKLRRAYQGLRELGLGIDAARAAAMLAKVLLSKGEIEEAKSLSHESEELAGDDLKAAIAWRGVRAEALAKGDEHDDAIKLARKAVSIAEKTDALLDHADARQALAVALLAAGQTQEAGAEELHARKLWEDKGATLLLDERENSDDSPSVSETPPNHSSVSPPVELTVHPSAQRQSPVAVLGTASTEAIARQDFSKFRSLFHEDFRELDHSTGVSYGIDGLVESLENLFKAENPFHKTEVLGILGSNLTLFKRHWGASGSPGKLMDVGAFEGSAIVVMQAIDDGVWIDSEAYAANKLGDATARLYKRYAESLPEGSERERSLTIARSVKWTLTDDHSISIKEAMVPDMQGTDHRPVVGHETVGHFGQHLVETTEELIQNLQFHLKDIIALAPDALLRATRVTGNWKDYGGEGEIDLLMLSVFGPDGRQTQLEWFDPSQLDLALARFNKLTSRPEPARHKVQPNLAIEAFQRTIRLAVQGDWNTMRALSHQDYLEIHHPTSSRFGIEGSIESIQRLFRSDNPVWRFEPLATLGPQLCLSRSFLGASGTNNSRYDVGAYESIYYPVTEVDENGRTLCHELFAENKLGDAIARLYERYAESLSEPPEKTKALGLANIIRAGTGPIDPERLKPFWSDKVQLVDHRTAGMGTIDSAEAVTEAISVMAVELTEDFTGQFDDVVSLRPDALLCHYTTGGKGLHSGGDFEQLAWYLMIADEQGRIARWEIFEEEHLEQARARFEVLTGSTNLRPSQMPKRHVVPNAATTAIAQMEKLASAGNFKSLRNLFHDDHQEIDHVNGATYGADGCVKGIERVMRSQEPYYRHDPLATLGPSLYLARRFAGGKSSVGGRYDVGAFEVVILHLFEVDELGLFRRSEAFADNKLGEALIRLCERYAESLADGVERTRALGIAEMYKAITGTMDYERFVACLAPDVVQHDHRHVGSGMLSGAEDVANATRVTLIELTENITGTIDGLLGLRSEGSLFHFTNTGTLRNSGGEFERNTWELVLHDDAGLLKHWERFDPKDADKALARFEELTGSTEKPSASGAKLPDAIAGKLPRGVAQMASHAQQQPDIFTFSLPKACNARDWAAARDCFSDDYIQISHPTGSSSGPDEVLKGVKSLFRAPDAEFHSGPLARLGDRLFLLWRYTRATGTGDNSRFDVGEYELLMYHVCEVDEQGRGWRDEVFADNRLGDAISRLYERYAETLPEAAQRDHPFPPVDWLNRFALGKVATEADFKAMRRSMVADCIAIDHRHVGFGTLTGIDAILKATLMMACELSDNYSGQLVDVRGLHPAAMLVKHVSGGIDRKSGGEWEREVWELFVFTAQGTSRWERYDDEHLDDALARFDELTNGTPQAPSTESKVIPNAASQALHACVTAATNQHWTAFRALMTDKLVELHHPAGASYGPDDVIKTFERLFRQKQAYWKIEDLATHGQHLYLYKSHSGAHGTQAGARFDVGAFETHLIGLTVVNEQGLLLRNEIFAEHQLDEAYARFAELIGDTETKPVKRIVQPNIATAGAEKSIKEIAKQNWDVVRNWLHHDLLEIDHTTGAKLSPDEMMSSVKLLFKGDDPVYQLEPLASLGPHLMLGRRSVSSSGAKGKRFDVGPYAHTALHLVEVDDEGLLRHAEVFAENKLGEAVARLYERHAESLPEGPERERAMATAHTVSLTLTHTTPQPGEEGYTPHLTGLDNSVVEQEAFVPDVQGIDHRPVVGGIQHGSWFQNMQQVMSELVSDISFELKDVFALSSEALLRHTTYHGHLKEGGGEFELDMYLLSVFGPDGRQTQVEAFQAGQEEKALARFEEVTAGAKPVAARRRLKPNLASRAMNRFAEAVKTQQWSDITDIVSEDYQELHHPTGSTFGRDETIKSFKRLYRSEGAYYQQEIIATLGEKFCLMWGRFGASAGVSRNFDVGPYENIFYVLMEVNEQGKNCRGEVFSENKLGEAIARLYERYAQQLPEGPERDRANTLAHTVALMITTTTKGPVADAFSADNMGIDHRLVGHEQVGNFIQRFLKASKEVYRDTSFQINDVLALNNAGLLRQTSISGYGKESGGFFELEVYLLSIFGPDGLQSALETFEAGQEEKALARFDELTSNTAATPQSVPERRVTPNLATEWMKRWDTAVASQDWTAIRALISDNTIEIDHPNGTSYGPDAVVSRIESLWRSDNPWARNDPIVTLGDRLGLFHRHWGASGAQGKRYEVGAYEHGVIMLAEASPDGRHGGNTELFAENKLGEAVARLYERYADLLPAGNEQQHAQQVAASYRALLTPFDMDVMGPRLATDMVFIDNRLLGSWHGTGKNEAVKHIHALNEVADNIQLYDEGVLATEPNLLLVQRMTRGIERVGGGEYERPLLLLMGFDHQGLNNRWEFFDVGDEAKALARFDELTADAPPTLIPQSANPNTAADGLARVLTAMNMQDWADLRATYSDDYVEIHHPTGSTFGPEQSVKSIKANLESENGYHEITQIAALGARLFLNHMRAGASGKASKRYDIGPYEHRFVSVVQTNDQGLNERHEVFAEEKLGDALVRIYELYAESLPEGPEQERARRIASGWSTLNGPVDIEHMTNVTSPSCKLVDHRIYGAWTSGNAEEMLQHFRAQLELAPDFACRMDEVIELAPDAACLRYTYYGTDRTSGGLFENCFCGVHFFGANEQGPRIEVFEKEDIDKAQARFNELTVGAGDETGTEPLEPSQNKIETYFSNAAAKASQTYADLFMKRDWDGIKQLFLPDLHVLDHQPHVQLELNRDEFITFARQLGDMQSTQLTLDLLATRGERLCLARAVFVVSDDDVGSSDFETLNIAELDVNGTIATMIRFSPEAIDEAYAELDRRYFAGEAIDRQANQQLFREAIARRDWEAVQALAAPEFVEEDHRSLAVLGTRHGPQSWAETSKALVDLAPDTQVRMDHIRLGPQCSLNHATFHGTQDGGHYEMPFITVALCDADERLIHHDLYEPEQIEIAAEKFKQLSQHLQTHK